MEEPNKAKPNTPAPMAPAVETFTQDMVQVIEDDKGGLIKKIIKEQEAHEIEQKNLSPESKRNRVFVFVGLILILLAVVLLAFLFFKQTSQNIPLVISPISNQASLIFTDKQVTLDVSGLKADIVADNILSAGTNSNIRTGGIAAITLTEAGKAVGLRRFIQIIKSSFFPGDINLISDKFLMGVVRRQAETPQGVLIPSVSYNDFFILIKTRSFVDIFPAMRDWETSMFSDLHGLFGINLTSDTNYLLKTGFQDGIVDNKNARILYDKAGNIVLMYVFADDQSVIIANNINAVSQVMLRLAGNQIKQ